MNVSSQTSLHCSNNCETMTLTVTFLWVFCLCRWEKILSAQVYITWKVIYCRVQRESHTYTQIMDPLSGSVWLMGWHTAPYRGIRSVATLIHNMRASYAVYSRELNEPFSSVIKISCVYCQWSSFFVIGYILRRISHELWHLNNNGTIRDDAWHIHDYTICLVWLVFSDSWSLLNDDTKIYFAKLHAHLCYMHTEKSNMPFEVTVINIFTLATKHMIVIDMIDPKLFCLHWLSAIISIFA